MDFFAAVYSATSLSHLTPVQQKWPSTDPEVVVEVKDHRLEDLEGEEGEGEVIRLVQEVEVDLEVPEGNPFSTVPE